MDKLELFGFIQTQDKDRKVLDRLQLHVDEGMKLPWFQEVIPGLIPGVKDDQAWLEDARKLLWSTAEYSTHKAKLDRKEKLLQPSPSPLARDHYHLQQHWPVYVEALRPMPERMLAAANEIYRLVAREDCLTEDRNVAGVTWKIDEKHFAFVTVAVALQDKVLTPIISDIERRQKGLGVEIQRKKDQQHGLRDRYEHTEAGEAEADEQTSDDNDEQAVQQRLGHLIKEEQESQALLKALKRFRDILVDEKEVRDRRKDLKRGLVVEQPDSDEASSQKSSKLWLPFR